MNYNKHDDREWQIFGSLCIPEKKFWTLMDSLDPNGLKLIKIPARIQTYQRTLARIIMNLQHERGIWNFMAFLNKNTFTTIKL